MHQEVWSGRKEPADVQSYLYWTEREDFHWREQTDNKHTSNPTKSTKQRQPHQEARAKHKTKTKAKHYFGHCLEMERDAQTQTLMDKFTLGRSLDDMLVEAQILPTQHVM